MTKRCTIKWRAYQGEKLGVPSAVDKLPSSESRQDLGSAFPAQPSLSGADDGMRPVGHLQLRKDVGDVVAYGVGLTNRRAAILALVCPWAMRSSISTSREVSSGKASSGEAGLGEEKKSTRRRAISGPK